MEIDGRRSTRVGMQWTMKGYRLAKRCVVTNTRQIDDSGKRRRFDKIGVGRHNTDDSRNIEERVGICMYVGRVM